MTHGNTSTKENIMNIFGPKQLQSVLEFKQALPDEEISEEYGLKPEQSNCNIFRITGFISKPDHGQGRSSTDRQFFFINRRPCDFQKVTKVVNEVYHMYNRNQFPFVVLDISLAKEKTDVNLTPDKRMILVQEEKTLLAIIKTSLKQMFAPRAAMYDINQPTTSSSPGNLAAMFSRGPQKAEASPNTQTPSSKLTLAGLKRSFSASGFLESDSSAREAKQPKLDVFFRRSKSEVDSMMSPSVSSSFSSSQSFSLLQDGNSQTLSSQDGKEESLADSLYHSASECSLETSQCTPKASNSPLLQRTDSPTEETITQVVIEASEKNSDATIVSAASERTNGVQELTEEIKSGLGRQTGEVESKELWSKTKSSSASDVVNLIRNVSQESVEESDQVVPKYEMDCTEQMSFTKKEVAVPFSISGMKKRRKLQNDKDCSSKPDFRQNFRAKIKPSDNNTAEEELKKVFSKTSFKEMEVIGQFNLGFLIAKLKSDLFIVDQHATDEKFNFEDLQKNTVLQSQRLIQPMKLELTAVNEMILKDNLEIFRKNGFEFSFNEEAPLIERVKLTSAPVSKSWTFGKEDVDEMIFMLSDAPGTMCRPSRIRQMFASRSCRKSVMIGTALNKSEMTKLISHMADLEQPWNCPHGRPTFRHLFNLNMLPD